MWANPFNPVRDYWVKNFRRLARPDASGRSRIFGRSIYILPTRQGLVMVVVLVLMLIGSVNYGSNLGYLVTFLLGGVWLISILHTWRNLLGLRIQTLSPQPVFAGEDALFRFRLENPGKTSRFGIRVAGSPSRSDTADIPFQCTETLAIPIPAECRGWLQLDEVTVHTRYPLGLFHAWSYARVDVGCLVYPRPAPSGEPPLIDLYSPNESGTQGLGSDDFIGLRDYREGDSPRHVDWKAHARDRGLYSKQFGGDRTQVISLDWDLLSDPDPEQRLSQLCRFVLLADKRKQRYGLSLPGKRFEPTNEPSHKENCLAALARFEVPA